jgi:hypothetical protein
MCSVIGNPASCRISNVIHFLHAENLSAAEICHELCMVYSPDVLTVDSGVKCIRRVCEQVVMVRSGVVGHL